MGAGLRGWAWSVCSVLLVSSQFALALDTDPGCEGALSGVYDLRHPVPPMVEKIASDRADTLARYMSGLNVEQQLHQQGAYGYMAIRDERIVGFIVAERRRDHIQILSVAVAQGADGHGIGRELVEKVLADARIYKEARVLVPYNDDAARGFFAAMGMKPGEPITGKFDSRRTSGVFYKISTEPVAEVQPQLQLARQPAPKPRLQVETIPISLEELYRLDPTLANAR